MEVGMYLFISITTIFLEQLQPNIAYSLCSFQVETLTINFNPHFPCSKTPNFSSGADCHFSLSGQHSKMLQDHHPNFIHDIIIGALPTKPPIIKKNIYMHTSFIWYLL